MARNKRPGKRKGSMIEDSIFYDSRLENLSFSAFRLFVELNQQYNGFNNGNLSTAKNSLRFDWNEKTIQSARTELLKSGVIDLTRQGIKRRPNLYALTHVPIDDIEKHGIKAEETCRRRATGNRDYYFPTRRDIRSELTKALRNAKK